MSKSTTNIGTNIFDDEKEGEGAIAINENESIGDV